MTYEREKWKKNEHMYEDRRIQNKKSSRKLSDENEKKIQQKWKK